MPVWLSFRNKVQARYVHSIKADIRFAAQGVIKMPTSTYFAKVFVDR